MSGNCFWSFVTKTISRIRCFLVILMGHLAPQHSILVRILLVTLFWDTLYISVLNAKLHHQTKYKGFFWPQNVLPRKFSGRNGLSPSQFRHYPSSTARVFKSTRLRCQRGPGIKLSSAWGQLSCPQKYKMILLSLIAAIHSRNEKFEKEWTFSRLHHLEQG